MDTLQRLVLAASLLLIAIPLHTDMLELAARGTGEGDNADYAGRIRLDYGRLEAGLLVGIDAAGTEEQAYRISGGILLPLYTTVLKAGSLSIAGPLTELSSPTQAGALSPLYYRYSSVGLYRGWDPGESRAVAWGLPGLIWCCYEESPDSPAETSICASLEILPDLRLEAAGLYFVLPEEEEDEWILADGVPAAGEHLLSGLGLIRQGCRLDLSLFGAASFHPLLPAGGYLRLQSRRRGSYSLVGVRLSAADRYYRTPRDHRPPFARSAAAQLRLFPGGRLQPVLELTGRQEHPPLDGRLPFDWRGAAAGGVEYATEKLSASLLREAELRREEGEHSSRERLRATAAWKPNPGSFLEIKGTYRLGLDLLEKSGLEGGIRGSELGCSAGLDWKRESDFGEPPGAPLLCCRAELNLTGDKGYLRLKMSIEEGELGWRLEGGRRICVGEGKD